MSLLIRDTQAPEKWFDEFPVMNRYTYGLAGERFYRAIKDSGQIFGTRCYNCHITYVPARIFCERCFTELTDWIDVGAIGELYTFTLLYKNLDGSINENPIPVGFVKIADGGLIHLLGEMNPEEITIGMKLKAKFKPKRDRIGSITDIQFFIPVK
ncbi:MAG: Zn-ribbon domain-containing OB-fold protein [Chloroflexi bacterium]|nr:Zn-ribbon domain-containing OB-fold protein [Chloroflexota bacterium]